MSNNQTEHPGVMLHRLLLEKHQYILEIEKLRGVIVRNCDPFTATSEDKKIIDEITAYFEKQS